MSLTEKDIKTLVSVPNNLLAKFHERVMLTDMPESVLDFYENNKNLINGEVVIVRSKDDEGVAAIARNTKGKVLFVFSDGYWMNSYFSSVSHALKLPQALIKRVNRYHQAKSD